MNKKQLQNQIISCMPFFGGIRLHHPWSTHSGGVSSHVGTLGAHLANPRPHLAWHPSKDRRCNQSAVGFGNHGEHGSSMSWPP